MKRGSLPKSRVKKKPPPPGKVKIAEALKSLLREKDFGAITPQCKKKGYVQKSFGVGSSFSAVTMVNILFWPGFIVDAMSGAASKYPSHITVIMEKSTNK